MHDWCVCMCMSVPCLRGGRMFRVVFPVWICLTYLYHDAKMKMIILLSQKHGCSKVGQLSLLLVVMCLIWCLNRFKCSFIYVLLEGIYLFYFYYLNFHFRAWMYHSRSFPTKPFDSSKTLETRRRSGHDIGEKFVSGVYDNYCPGHSSEYIYLVLLCNLL